MVEQYVRIKRPAQLFPHMTVGEYGLARLDVRHEHPIAVIADCRCPEPALVVNHIDLGEKAIHHSVPLK